MCGGKGYNLSRLHRYGFRVPAGGVLPAGAPLDTLPEGLERLGLSDVSVAVRSSATGEDSARASFAGIHHSFLNVKGASAVMEAAQGCVRSLETPEAVAYRRRMGFRDEEVRCSVVVCAMVDARAAGVAFSCDPLTGRRDLIRIDAAEGLADGLVSGRVKPVESTWVNHLGSLHRMDGPGGLLPAEVERELAHTVLRVQWALGEGCEPQDVEWAWDGMRLWLVQARPVTRMPRAGFPQTAQMPRYWSTGNIKDAVPGVVCELSWSTLCDIVGEAAFAAQKAAGYPMPPGMEIVRRIDGRGYFDLTAMQWAFFDAFGIKPAEIVKVIGGHQPEIAIPAGAENRRDKGRRQRAGLKLLRALRGSTARTQRAVEEQIELGRQLGGADFASLSRQQMLELQDRIFAAQQRILPVVGMANSSTGPWQTFLDGMVRDPSLVAQLQAGSGQVASAEHGYRLYEIARGESTVEEFLKEFGHRAVYEADFVHPRWVEDPGWIEAQVESIRANPPKEDPRRVAQRARETAERAVRRRFGLRAPLVLWFAKKLRAANGAREAAKSGLVSMGVPVRRLVMEMGLRLVGEGKLDAPESALHLAVIDVRSWLEGFWDGTGAQELTMHRRERRERWLARPAADLVEEAPDGSIATKAAEEAASAGAEGWSGLAVSAGKATGPARILHTPREAERLMEGDVLVAPSTDPGWTPLFLRASALVMETGGYLSHGAIVAREFGIPAVANVPGILAALKDGETIRVDGSAGRVARERTEEPEG